VSYPSQRSRQREQRENTREAIIEAAETLLRERPYRELSVDLVMAQTGLTRTAFYRHFDDIPSLVLRLLADVGRELYEVGERWRAGAVEDLRGSAHQGLEAIVEFFLAHGRLIRAVADGAASDEMLEAGYRQFRDAFGVLIIDGLEAMVARGQLEVPDTRVMARALNLMNEAFLLDTFGRVPLGDPNVALATLETIWLRVLAPE
jgi:TetR/AcrR family transcriptional regulator, ethionamide resistance regulator